MYEMLAPPRSLASSERVTFHHGGVLVRDGSLLCMLMIEAEAGVIRSAFDAIRTMAFRVRVVDQEREYRRDLRIIQAGNFDYGLVAVASSSFALAPGRYTINFEWQEEGLDSSETVTVTA